MPGIAGFEKGRLQGLATEDQVQQIIEYIRSIGPGSMNKPAVPMRAEVPTRVTEGVPKKSATPPNVK